MARNEAGCLCRVPLSEGVVPVFERDRDQSDWLAARGIELQPDYLNRPSIALADAYRLRREADEAVAADTALRAKRAASVAAQAVKAQERRQQTFDRAVAQAGPVHPQAAQQAGWAAVVEAEQGLDPQVRALLTSPLFNADNAVYQHLHAQTFAANEV